MLSHSSRWWRCKSSKGSLFSKPPVSPRSPASGFLPTVQLRLRLQIRFCSADFRHKMVLSDRHILPDNVKPLNYNLSLFDLEFGGGWRYNGIVKIDAAVQRASTKIVLNSKELEISSARLHSVENEPTEWVASTIDIDTSNERATLNFDHEIPGIDHAVLTICFKGHINSAMAGFYRSKYKPTVTPTVGTAKQGDDYYMFSTQFEPCEARRAFPCFDEPNLKATFEFEVEVPENQVALSNMPEKATRKGSKDGWKVVSFAKTPVMSTYLAAWAIGDFEYVEAHTERKYNGRHLPVRVYTTKGLKEQGRFALWHACKTIDFFSETFEIDYPLPKSDLLAVHEFAMGAMENWGLVTYRTLAVLFDEAKSDSRHKNRVAYVVAHELAHQWFGNLVTMSWWNELWLNEGFATWVGWYAVDHLHPDWKVWSQFVAEAVQTALQLDSLRASHAIEVPVRNAHEVDQIFDHISYLKGSSVIRMLSNHLGNETFLKGVAAYLKKHAYGNATTNDLWDALGKASGKDVKQFMDPWIRKIGFPVVTVAEEPGQISVRQSRFLTTGDVRPEDDETTWWIPLGLTSGAEIKSAGSALTVKEDTIRDIDNSFYKLNTNQSGFYRTNYPADRLMQLGQRRERLSTQDKIGLMGDATALAVAGDGTTAGLLTLLEGFRDEENYLVWSQIQTSLAKCRAVFASNEKVFEGLRKFALRLVSPAAEKIGWEFKDDDDYLTVELRKLLLGMAGGAGHESIIAEGKKRFQAWKSGEELNPNLRRVVLNMTVASGGHSEYDAVKQEYFRSTSANDKDACLQALGRARESELARDLLEFVTSEAVPIQDSHYGPSAVSANNSTRNEVWKFTQRQWRRLNDRLGVSNVCMDRWMKMGLNSYSDHGIEKEISEFFKDKDSRAYDRSLVVISDTIKGNANYKQREEKLVLEWLEAHGYA